MIDLADAMNLPLLARGQAAQCLEHEPGLRGQETSYLSFDFSKYRRAGCADTLVKGAPFTLSKKMYPASFTRFIEEELSGRR
jgi:hypothetical protein